MEEIEREVRAFIVENFLFGNADDAPEPEESFMEIGLIDSTGVLEMVAFLEEKYEIEIDDDQLTPDNLDSIRQIAKFVDRLRGES
jgi:acyl carrier protein